MRKEVNDFRNDEDIDISVCVGSIGGTGVAFSEDSDKATVVEKGPGMPIITDWSSEGGDTQNKSDAKDRMYLVRPGDKITFSVKAGGADKYVWADQ